MAGRRRDLATVHAVNVNIVQPGERLLKYEGSEIRMVWPLTDDRGIRSQNSQLSKPELPQQ